MVGRNRTLLRGTGPGSWAALGKEVLDPLGLSVQLHSELEGASEAR
jgi:hypothetical protein